MSFINIADETRQFNTYQVSKIVKSYTEMMDKLNISFCEPSFVVNFRRLLLAEYNFIAAVKALAIDRTVKDSSDDAAVVRTDDDGDHYGSDSYIKFNFEFKYIMLKNHVKMSGCLYVSDTVVLMKDIYIEYVDKLFDILVSSSSHIKCSTRPMCTFCSSMSDVELTWQDIEADV